VEFDTVAIVGWNETFFSTEHIVDGAREEVGRMHKDLLYVALTRAMEKLVILK
jgi:superfamily I DNA/RNA helicase